MILWNFILSTVATLLSYALPGVSVATLHTLAVSVIVVVAAIIVIVFPGLLLVAAVVLVVLYLTGTIK